MTQFVLFGSQAPGASYFEWALRIAFLCFACVGMVLAARSLQVNKANNKINQRNLEILMEDRTENHWQERCIALHTLLDFVENLAEITSWLATRDFNAMPTERLHSTFRDLEQEIDNFETKYTIDWVNNRLTILNLLNLARGFCSVYRQKNKKIDPNEPNAIPDRVALKMDQPGGSAIERCVENVESLIGNIEAELSVGPSKAPLVIALRTRTSRILSRLHQ